MKLKYRLIKRANPLDRTRQKWYATPVYAGRIERKDLDKEIVNMSSLSRGDVSNAIENFLDIIPKYLMMGKSVSLGELGTLRLSFSSMGVDQPEHLHARMIRSPRVVFIPSPELRKSLKEITFEKEEEK